MKIKLKDLTKEQYQEWENKNCKWDKCDNCIFNNVMCEGSSTRCWVKHKYLYSNSFLNQTLEIEDEPILDAQEKAYLEFVLKPFKDKTKYIEKNDRFEAPLEHICCRMNDDDALVFPDFDAGTRYKGMELYKEYTLKELGLFQDDYDL